MEQKTIIHQEYVECDQQRTPEREEHTPEAVARAFFARVAARADIRDLLRRLADE